MRKLCILLAVVFCFAVGGIYATWEYGGLPLEPNVEKMGTGSLPSAASQYRVKYSIDPETWYSAKKEA